jgi:hypothetical protein
MKIKWHKYLDEDPPDEMIDEILPVRGVSVVDPFYTFEVMAKWSGTCFMTLEDEPKSWSGPLRSVTHWGAKNDF